MEIVGETKKNKTITGKLFLIVIILIVAFIAFRIFVYKKPISKPAEKKVKNINPPSTAEITQTPTLSSELEPTASPSSQLKLKKYKVWILNGSGKAGEAKKASNLLEEKGFNISKTENADNYDYENTIIKAKKKVEQEFIDKIKEELKTEYKISEDENLEASESADVIIIIGKE